jgi:mRNA-degrading endonuclease toxin of MazEF toxin-antitoxin module
MPVQQGDIYWVFMPEAHTKGTEQKKNRGYVIVSRNSVNFLGRNVVGVPLSEKVEKACQHKIKIPVSQMIADPTWRTPLIDLVALTDQIRVLDPSRLLHRMGSVSGSALISVELGLHFLFETRQGQVPLKAAVKAN